MVLLGWDCPQLPPQASSVRAVLLGGLLRPVDQSSTQASRLPSAAVLALSGGEWGPGSRLQERSEGQSSELGAAGSGPDSTID